MWHRVLTLFLIALFTGVKADVLKQAEGVDLVRAHCGVCHSLQLVTQHRMSRSGWIASIRYMQKNHNLWPLGEQENALLDYLESNYGSESVARKRRKNLPQK